MVRERKIKLVYVGTIARPDESKSLWALVNKETEKGLPNEFLESIGHLDARYGDEFKKTYLGTIGALRMYTVYKKSLLKIKTGEENGFQGGEKKKRTRKIREGPETLAQVEARAKKAGEALIAREKKDLLMSRKAYVNLRNSQLRNAREATNKASASVHRNEAKIAQVEIDNIDKQLGRVKKVRAAKSKTKISAKEKRSLTQAEAIASTLD